jgi:hypothetical protein
VEETDEIEGTCYSYVESENLVYFSCDAGSTRWRSSVRCVLFCRRLSLGLTIEPICENRRSFAITITPRIGAGGNFRKMSAACAETNFYVP